MPRGTCLWPGRGIAREWMLSTVISHGTGAIARRRSDPYMRGPHVSNVTLSTTSWTRATALNVLGPQPSLYLVCNPTDHQEVSFQYSSQAVIQRRRKCIQVQGKLTT